MSSEIHTTEAGEEELKGEDKGGQGILTRLVFNPNPESVADMTDKEKATVAEQELSRTFYKKCEEEGLWPDAKYGEKGYDFHKQDDGSYLLISYRTRKGANILAKDEDTIGDIIGINTQ